MRSAPGVGRQERWINVLTARRGLEDRDHLGEDLANQVKRLVFAAQ